MKKFISIYIKVLLIINSLLSLIPLGWFLIEVCEIHRLF